MPLARQNALKTSDSLPSFPSNRPNKSKLSIKVLVAQGIHVAGSSIRGELEISVKDRALGLGEVGIELTGVEELRNRDHTATKRIIYSRLLFQGPGLPPSNAVVAGSSPSQGGYYPALRGRTRFDYKFDLPKDLPSTCQFGAAAVVRYELRAFASSLFEGDVDLRSEKKEVLVVERWDDWRKGNWATGVHKQAEQDVRGREAGTVSIKGGIGNDEWSGSLPRLFWWRDVDEGIEGKGSIEIRVRVNNATKRHIPGLKVTLIRRLRLHRDRTREGPAPPQLSTNITAVDFLGTDYDVRAGSEREVVVVLQLPKDECWNARKGSLFDLDCFVKVQVEGGFLDPKLCLEMPVWIAHPFSISNTAHRLIDSERTKYNLQVEVPTSPSVPFLRSPRSTLDFSSPSPTGESHAPSEVAQPHRLGTSQRAYHYAGTAVSHAPAFQPSPVQPAFALPPPPSLYSSPEPFPLPHPHNGRIAFDPSLPDITPSRFFGALQSQQPQHVYGIPALPQAGTISRTPVFSHETQLPPNFAPPPSLSRPPVPPLDSHPSRQPSPQCAPASNIPALEPLEPYSAAQRAHQDPRTSNPASPCHHEPASYSSPPAVYVPERQSLPPSCPSPGPSAVNVVSSSRTPLRTPPPPSPSAHYRNSSPSSSLSITSAVNPIDTVALDTIGEDGESQAGTTKSQALGEGVLKALREDQEESGIHSVRVGNSPRSTSVQDLEELVAEEERKHEADQQQSKKAKELPDVPLSAQESNELNPATVRAQDIFGDAGDKPPSRSKNSNAPNHDRSQDGLAALQARLARSTSPFKPACSPSPSPTKPESPAPALAVPKATSALRARSLSRSSRQKDKDLAKALEEAEEDPAEGVKRALAKANSSAAKGGEQSAPPPPNVSSEVWKAITAMKNLEVAPQGESKVTSSVDAKPPLVDLPIRGVEKPLPVPRQDVEEAPARVASPPARPPSRPIFGSSASPTKRQPTLPSIPIASASTRLTSIDLSSPVEPRAERETRAEEVVPKVNEQGRKVVSAVEIKELKKEAVVRVGDWLSSESKPTANRGISPWSSLSKSQSNINLQTQPVFGRQAPPPPASSPEPSTAVNVAAAIAESTSFTRPATTESELPTVAQLIAAETRAELRRIEGSSRKPSPVLKGMDGSLAASKQAEEFEPTYHHSSARGGKGGKVTSVATIWASREEGAAKIPIPTPILRHKATKSLSNLEAPTAQPLSPVGNAPLRTNRRSLQVVPDPVAAKPFLNTTLGRSTSASATNSRKPAQSSDRPPLFGKEQVKPTDGNGGIKVKDILARYQQQIARD